MSKTKQNKKHLVAMGNCGENWRVIWKKEEVWIGPTEFYNHFAKTDFKHCKLSKIVLLLKTSFDSQYCIFITKQKDSDLTHFSSILTTIRLNSFPKYSKIRVQIKQTLWDVIIIYHKRFISICGIITIIKILKTKTQDSPFTLKYNIEKVTWIIRK